MFTGIVDRKAEVSAVEDVEGGRILALRVPDAPPLPPWTPVALGESIAVDGVCLTTIRSVPLDAEQRIWFEAVPETLRLTTLARLAVGDQANVERSLAAGDRFGGHYVTGHIDGVGRVARRTPQGEQVLFEVQIPSRLLRQVIPKGSVAVDGISLTVVEVLRDKSAFTFAAIPHTLERTTLVDRAEGAEVNIETDAFGKWVLHALDDVGGEIAELARRAVPGTSREAGPK